MSEEDEWKIEFNSQVETQFEEGEYFHVENGKDQKESRGILDGTRNCYF